MNLEQFQHDVTTCAETTTTTTITTNTPSLTRVHHHLNGPQDVSRPQRPAPTRTAPGSEGTGQGERGDDGPLPVVCSFFLSFFSFYCIYWLLGDHYHHQHHLDVSTPTTASLTCQNATTTTSTRPNASTTTTKTHNNDKRGPRRFSGPWYFFCMSCFCFLVFQLTSSFSKDYAYQRPLRPPTTTTANLHKLCDQKRVHHL